MRPTLFAPTLATIALLVGTSLAQGAEWAAGRDLANAKCKTCHGIDGIAKIPIAPHIAGESTIYLQTQLKAFRIGKRVHEIMSVIAEDLSDEDIANLAAWYSAIKIEVTMPE